MTPEKRLKKIKNWLDKNPAIRKPAICKAINLDRSNFQNALSGTRPLPAKYLDPLEKELEKYGYKK